MLGPHACIGTLFCALHASTSKSACAKAKMFCLAAHLSWSSLELQPMDILQPLQTSLLENDRVEAAVMVMDAMSVCPTAESVLASNKEAKADFIKRRAYLEVRFAPRKAMHSLSECFKLGGGDARDYLLYGALLYQEEDDLLGAINALSHAVAICEPSERFGILVECGFMKTTFEDLPGALKRPFRS